MLLSFSSSAQNWSLISSGKYLNYNKAGQPLVDGTLRVGMAYAEGADSVFILQPKRAKYYQSYPYVEAVGHILGDSTFVHPGGIYEFRFNDFNAPQPTTVVHTQANLGETWAYQPGIKATVATVKDTVIWGQNDSLKIIQLSDGRSFRLSKNVGLIEYDGLVLSGLQGQGIGTQLPTMADWYGDWQPGAIFETRYSSVSNYITKRTVWAKFYVQHRVITNDSLKLTCRRLNREEWSYNNQPPNPTFSNQVVTVVVPAASQAIYPGADYSTGVIRTFYENTSNGLTVTRNRIITPSSSGPIEQKTHSIGKGVTYEEFAYGYIGDVFTSNFYLIGSQLPGQMTVGTIHPDSFFGIATDVNEQADDLSIKVFPNPVSDGWIQVARSSDEPLENIQLVNLNGQVVREWTRINSKSRLELNHLTPGIYLLQIKTENGERITRKLLVQQ